MSILGCALGQPHLFSTVVHTDDVFLLNTLFTKDPTDDGAPLVKAACAASFQRVWCGSRLSSRNTGVSVGKIAGFESMRPGGVAAITKSSQSETSRGGVDKAYGPSWRGAFRRMNKLPIKGRGWGVEGRRMNTQNKTIPRREWQHISRKGHVQ